MSKIKCVCDRQICTYDLDFGCGFPPTHQNKLEEVIPKTTIQKLILYCFNLITFKHKRDKL